MPASRMKCEDELGYTMKMTSFAAACNKGNIAITRQLLHCVTPRIINTPCGDYDDTALHHVIWQAEDFISYPLFLVCASKTLARVSDLLYDQDVNTQYKDGYTLLHFSCALCFKEGVEILLSVCADKEITADDRKTAVDAAKYYNNNNDIVKLSSASFV